MPIKALASISLVIGLTLLLMNYSKSDTHPSGQSTQSIARIWRGWTTHDNAEQFEQILTTQAIPGIEKNKPSGYLGIPGYET